MSHFSLTQLEQMRSRINRKGINGNDIKVHKLLTDDEIADLPVEKIHYWVRQGIWNQKDFKRWLKIIRVIE
jgi:hypothetical protein